jgi:pyridoxamine 5'-phosphate oxidase
MSLMDMRQDYTRARFDEADAADDPFAQFDKWFTEARTALADSAAWEPNAMTLATVDARGRPTARVVLLKGVDARGFTFFTNYDSDKGQALAAHPFAALVFYWNALERQVRIEGSVEKLSDVDSDAYFRTRPMSSRHSAIASPQSRRVESRAALEEAMQRATVTAGDDPARPAHWGGYRVLPERFEFWQGRASRLHDRLVYLPALPGWTKQRLAP